MMRIHTLARCTAMDRRKAAIHEAGHAIIVRAAGAYADPKIWPLHDLGEYRQKKTWVGTCETFGVPRLSMTKQRMVGFAGVVAEMLFDKRNDDCFASYTNVDYCEEFFGCELASGMSESDLRAAELNDPFQFGHRHWLAVSRVVEFLHPSGCGWQNLLQEANRIISFWRGHHNDPDFVAAFSMDRRGAA